MECPFVSSVLFKMEEEHLYALRWKELEMQSLALQSTLHTRTWAEERALLQEELGSLRQSIFLFYIKLRWLLIHWRQAKQTGDKGEDGAEVMWPEHCHSLTSTSTTLGHPMRLMQAMECSGVSSYI